MDESVICISKPLEPESRSKSEGGTCAKERIEDHGMRDGLGPSRKGVEDLSKSDVCAKGGMRPSKRMGHLN
jgi:hypothetical protein